eukprot:6198415-Pleurochrysis_carterae.AAC.1
MESVQLSVASHWMRRSDLGVDVAKGSFGLMRAFCAVRTSHSSARDAACELLVFAALGCERAAHVHVRGDGDAAGASVRGFAGAARDQLQRRQGLPAVGQAFLPKHLHRHGETADHGRLPGRLHACRRRAQHLGPRLGPLST